jgi:hypothetical protein
MGLDSIKRFYPSNVVFIGFDSTSRLTVPPYSVEYDTLKNRINSRSEVMEDQESFPGFVDGNRPGPFNGFPANSAPGNFWTPEITLILSAIFIVGFMTVRFLTKKRIAA